MTDTPTPTITMRLEVYRGVTEIANFLRMNERTVWRKIERGEIPVKKDGTGTWVLTNLDYILSLQG
jgi:hypothetical protein